MEYFSKDMLNYISNFLEIHDFHRLALCCKAFFKVYKNHVYQRLRSEKACLFRRRGFKENGQRNYCVRCKTWVRDKEALNHEKRCSYNQTLPRIHELLEPCYMHYDPICAFIDHSKYEDGVCPYYCLMRQYECESKNIKSESESESEIKMITWL